MSHPDYDDDTCCIAHSHAEKQGISWCSRYIVTEFTFISIDHAIYSLQQSRLLICPDCVNVIRQALDGADPDGAP